MKTKLTTLLICLMALFFSACEEDYGTPGLYVNQDVYETYPGDELLISGQVSSNAGIEYVRLSVDNWSITKEYHLNAGQNKVFNFNYHLSVPEDAQFDNNLSILVRDGEGNETQGASVLKYVPDTQAPTLEPAIAQTIAIDFDTSNGIGKWNLSSFTASDDRQLKQLTISIPELYIEKVIPLTGTATAINDAITFTAMGIYSATITLEDAGDNKTVFNTTISVIGPETDNGYEDYKKMYIIDADEDADNYVAGYYLIANRKDASTYEANIYAPHDNYHIYFTTEPSMAGKDLFGVSPFAGTKILNNKGYVMPITIEKAGYYGIYIDLPNHTFSTWELDTSAAYTGSLWPNLVGFEGIADWEFGPEMQRDGFVYTTTLTQNSDVKEHGFFLMNAGNWNAPWNQAYEYSTGDWEGWWENHEWDHSMYNYESTFKGNVILTYNTAILWGTIKKAK